MALSTSLVSKDVERQTYNSEYVKKGELLRQLYDGKFLWPHEKRIVIFAGVERYKSVRAGTKKIHLLLQQ